MRFWQGTASWQDFSWQSFAALTSRVAGNEQSLRRKFWRKLKREAASLPLAEQLLTAHYCAFDRQTPLYVKGVLVGAIVYFVVPDRFIPKYISADRSRRRCRGTRRGIQGSLVAYQAGTSRSGAAHADAAARRLIKRLPCCRNGRAHGRNTIFPITLRSEMSFIAAAISASGKTACTCADSLPSAAQRAMSPNKRVLSLRLALAPRAPEYAADVAALEQHQIKRDFGNFPGGESDHQVTALPGERTHRRFRVGPADRVIDHVDAVLAAMLLQRVAQIFLGVVDGLVGAVGAGEGEFFVRRRAGDDAGAHKLAEFDRREAGAAGRAEHGERLAGFELRPLAQRIKRRSVSDAEPGGAVEIERRRQLDQLLRWRSDRFARRAPAQKRHDAIAGRDFGHAGACAFDNAGELGHRRERKRRLLLVFAGDDQRVEEIERCGLNAHDGLAGSSVWRRNVGQFELIGRAEMGAQDGFHALVISTCCRRFRSRRCGKRHKCRRLALKLPVSFDGIGIGSKGLLSKRGLGEIRCGFVEDCPFFCRCWLRRLLPFRQSHSSKDRRPQACPPSGPRGRLVRRGKGPRRRRPRRPSRRCSRQFAAWGAYTASPGGKKVCFAIAKPTTAETKPPNRPRNPPYMFITTRPADKVTNEVSIEIGYPFKSGSEASAQVGTTTFALYTAGRRRLDQEQGGRIPHGRHHAPGRHRRGARANRPRGTKTTDTYSLKGLSEALDRIAKECQ